MSLIPSYYGSKWYDRKTDKLSNEAPIALQNEYRYHHASHYYVSKKRNGGFLAEYTDNNGVTYVINTKGVVLREGTVDHTKYIEIYH